MADLNQQVKLLFPLLKLITSKEYDVPALVQNLNTMNSNLDSVKKSLDDVNKTINDIKDELKVVKDQGVETQVSIKEIKAEQEELHNLTSANSAAVETNKQAIGANTRDIAALLDRIKTLESQQLATKYLVKESVQTSVDSALLKQKVP